MKNSKEYSQKLQKFYRSLSGKPSKMKRRSFDEPLDSLVYGIVSESLNEKAADAVVKSFDGYFVDINDLRVSLVEEIAEVLGKDTPDARGMALQLKSMLASVFENNNSVSLMPLRKLGKRPARQIIEELDGVSPFVADYCMLTAFGGHAIPLTQQMVQLLKDKGLVDDGCDDREIGGFLARQISANKGYEFYRLLRHASESGRGKKRSKVKAKKATVKKEVEAEKVKKVKKVKKKTKKTVTKKTRK